MAYFGGLPFKAGRPYQTFASLRSGAPLPHRHHKLGIISRYHFIDSYSLTRHQHYEPNKSNKLPKAPYSIATKWVPG